MLLFSFHHALRLAAAFLHNNDDIGAGRILFDTATTYLLLFVAVVQINVQTNSSISVIVIIKGDNKVVGKIPKN